MRRQDASRSLTVTGETPAPSRLKKMRAVLAWGKANSLGVFDGDQAFVEWDLGDHRL